MSNVVTTTLSVVGKVGVEPTTLHFPIVTFNHFR